MGKQKLSAGGYDILTSDPNSEESFGQKDIRKFSLDLERSEARKKRDAALKDHLSQYSNDPVSQAIATADFEIREQEAQDAADQAEYDNIASQYSDPLEQAIAVGKHYMKKADAPEAQRAFAENEQYQQIENREANVRALDRVGLGFAPLRETIGSAVQTAPTMLSILARVTGEDQAADYLTREAQQFGQAREQARADDMSPYLSRMYGGASQSLMQMAATPGGAMSKIAGAGLMSANEALTTAEDAGLQGLPRLRYAGTQGLLEAGIALIGQKLFGAGIESRLAGQAVAAQTWKELGKNISVDALKEMPEEVVTTILQDLSSKLEGVSADLSIGDFIANAVDSAVQSAMMAGLANTKNAAQLAIGRPPEKPPEIPQEVQDFIAKPSATNYESAVKAGLPPIENANRSGRSAYAKSVRERIQEQVDSLSGTPTPNPAPREPAQPAAPMETESPSGTVSDSEYQDVLDSILKGVRNGEEGNVQRQQDEQGQGQGQQQEQAQGYEARRQGELLTAAAETPAAPQDVASPPAVPQELAPPAESADEAKNAFQKEYRDTFAEWQKYSPDQAGSREYAAKLADLYDQNPAWADELHVKTEPVVAPGTPSPDQSAPSQTDPVSSTEPQAAVATEQAAEAASKKPKRTTWDDAPVGWIRKSDEDRSSYHKRLKQQGWKKSPKPSITVLDSPDRVDDLSIEQLKNNPFKAGDRVTLHTGFSGDDMQISAEIVEDSEKGESRVKVRTNNGNVHWAPAYYVTPDEPQAVREPSKIRRGKVGDMLASGEIVETSSGRQTTPFPKINFGTNRGASGTLKNIEAWLQSNALDEAESRGDDFNARQFRNETPGKIPPASKDSMEEYLFGEQPKVAPSILKPLTTAEQPSPAPAEPQAAASPQPDPQNWWNKTLTDPERAAIIKKSGLILPSKVQWEKLKPKAQEKIRQYMPTEPAVAPEATPEQPATETAPPESASPQIDIDAEMRAEFDRMDAEESAAKAKKTTKAASPSEKKPAKKRTKTGEKLGELSKKTGSIHKKATDELLQVYRDLDMMSGVFPGAQAVNLLNRKALTATAKFARTLVADGVVKFADYVMAFAENASPELAQKFSDYLEAAWRIAGERNQGLDPAGSVKDVLNSKKAEADETEPNEAAGDGGSEAAGRPLGEKRMEETSPDIVSANEVGGDAGRSGDAGGGRPEGEASGTARDGDEGPGSVPAGPERNDRTAGRPGRLDYRITGDDRIGEKFNPRERFDKNVEAIRVLKQIESENRRATPEEQKILAQYVGWGGLKEAFSTRDDQGLREKAILKDLLTEKELASARTSVRNAHYTSPEVISAMWSGLMDAGFTGGRILEPSMGIGHFYGLVPESVASVSKLSGIEMDSLTARIAQQLYQTADIQHEMYQDVNVKNPQDLVISNVPFGQYKIKDKHDKSLGRRESVHNFFFLKALKNVRPGGVIAFITSRYTMDTVDPSIREQISAAGGRFVGAVRLPNNAFMGIAKTKVTTDVIFIQKDAGESQPWRNTRENDGGFVFNEYFHDHPENVLGKIDPKGGTQINEWGIAPDGHNIGKELARKIADMPFDKAAMAENSTDGAQETEDAGESADVPDGRLAIRGNKLFKAVGGKLEEVPLWGGERGQERKFAIIREMGNLAAVRDKLSDLETSPLATDAEIEKARKLLNTTYDQFVKEHDFIHKGENQGLFRLDEQLPTLLALEEWDTDSKTAKKADVFEKRVQRPNTSGTTPTTAEGAAVESYARLGRIDLPLISQWLGKSEGQIEQELTGWAYKDPGTGEWSLKNVYLSGNIAKKLKDAEAAAKDNPAFQRNADDLRRVLPPRKTAGQIHVRPRSPFVTADQYQQFMRHIGVNGTVRHDDISGAWLIDNPHIEDPVKAGPWGVGRKTPADLLEGLLNNKPPVVWRRTYDGNREVDQAATQLARAKAKEIEDEFGRWIFSDPERALQIENSFNDTVGAFVEGEWDGSHLTLPGMNINITLLPHQKNAIWRAIVSGNTLLAHEVGLGKTFIMSAIAMERKRLGLATNQMFVVPNHLLSQWAAEFKALYPSAKLLALESDQINSKNRRTLMERIKSGRFDAIIVTPEAFKKMPMSNEIVEAKLREITQKIEETIKEARKAKGDNKNFVAKLESVLESIRGKMEVMLNDPAKDSGAKFDELGVDALYVDEAHEYRNLWSMTQMGDISGVGLDGNQKTFDMLLKTDFLNEKTKNRGIVFATGTPIANSISELYSMQRYLQPQTLAEAGVASFDDWANTFGEAVTDIEVDPTGSGFRSKTRFKEFRNTIALSKIFRQVADVKYAEDVGLDKVRPKLRGGKLNAIQIMPSLGLLDYVRNLVIRLEVSKKRSFDKRIDNPLKVTTDGRKAALDMRLVVPEEDGISSKINHAVENVARIYREEDERKGAQLLWVNLGTPASAKKKRSSAAASDPDADPTAAKMDNDEANLESGRINAYEDIKRKLIAQGIPENEIAFIHDHDDKDRKRALFQKVRDGKVRILISTVKKLATGANIQTRLAAMHFLDPPWKPADIEQALGRAIRRGNLYKDWDGVQAFTYVTRGSFDAYIWQLLENKAKAIKQIMRGESDSVEDTGRIELNADEVKALASSNPKVLELVKVRNEVGQLRAEYYGYQSEQGNIQSGIANLTHMVQGTRTQIANAEAELKTMPSRDDLHSSFEVTIGGKKYSKRSEIGAAMIEAIPAVDSSNKEKVAEQIKELAANPVQIGMALGKPIFVGRSIFDGRTRIIIGRKDGDYFEPSDDNTGNGVKLFNYFDKKYDEPDRLKSWIERTEKELSALKQRAGIPWPKSDRLTAAEESLRQLETELGSAAGDKNVLPVVSALTKFAIMAEKLGQQQGRPVTFDGTRWVYGDRVAVNPEAVTTEMEMEVDREVALILSDSKEQPHDSFFFHKQPVQRVEDPEMTPERRAAILARSELRRIHEANRQYVDTLQEEWRRIVQGRGPSYSFLGAPIPISDEMAKAAAGLMIGKVRAGIKRFDIFIKELRADLAEEAVRAMKPSLMNTWNGVIRPKYGLDEATDEQFDSAISETRDLEIQQATEPQPPEAEQQPEPDTEESDFEGRLYSTKNEYTDRERERLGMGLRIPLPGADRSASIDLAAKYGQTEDGRQLIADLISELTVTPRAVSPFENDLLNFRYAYLDQKRGKALAAKNAAREAGDYTQQAVNDTAASTYLTEQQNIVNLLSTTLSYASGASLQARKALINTDFSMARSMLEFESAYGRKPSKAEEDAMQKQIDELDAAKAELQKLIDELEAKNEDLETRLKEAYAAAHVEATKPKERTRKEAAREAVNAAWKEVGSLFGKVYSEVVPGTQATIALGKLAVAYANLGVVSLGDFLSRIRKRMGPDAENIIGAATEAWNSMMASGQADQRDAITRKIDPNDDQTIGRAARDLLGYVIRRDNLDASADGRTAAVNAVHDILREIIPGITADETARAMSGIGIYSEMSQEEAEIIRRDIKAQLLIMEQTKDWNAKQAPPPTGTRRDLPSDEQRALRRLRDEAKKASGIVTTSPGQLRSALDAAKRAISNRIADLEKAIRENTPIPKSRKVLPPNDELQSLRERRDELQKQYDEAFGSSELSDEQMRVRTERLLDKAIATLKEELKIGKLYPDEKQKREPVTSPSIEAKQAELAKLEANRDELRLSSGQAQVRSDAQFIRKLRERDAILAKRIAEKDFAPKKKKERVLTPEMLPLMRQVEQKKQAILEGRRKWEFDNRHIVYRMFMKGPMAGAHIIRKLLTTMDQSLIGRQGFLLGITHPVIYGKAIKNAFASRPIKDMSIYPTEQDLFNVQAALDADDNWVRLEKIAGVAVTDVHGGINREEGNQWVPEWVNSIWGVGGSERAGSAFINTQRRLVFRSLVEKLARKLGDERTISNAELRVIGNFVNVGSGRGSLGKYGNSVEALSAVFFSPRWWMSRLAWWSGQPVWHDSRWFRGEGASPEVRKMIAIEWGKQAVAQAAVMGLVFSVLKAAFGDPGEDEEWQFYYDLRSPKFGHVRIGKTDIDLTAGLGQHMSFFARLLSGKQVNRWDTEEVDQLRLIGRFERGKLAPVPAMIVDYLAGESIGGEKFGSLEWFKKQGVPLVLQDIERTRKEEGFPLGPIFSTLAFFGITSQSQEERTRQRKDAANEIRAMKKQGKSQEEIQAVIDTHLANAAQAEAREKLRTADPDEKMDLESVAAGEQSPAMNSAIQKERYDVAIAAIEMLSTESMKKDKQPDGDETIRVARSLLLEMAPTYEEANKLFTAAYKRKYGSLTDLVGGRFVTKKSVIASRRRLRKLYTPQ